MYRGVDGVAKNQIGIHFLIAVYRASNFEERINASRLFCGRVSERPSLESQSMSEFKCACLGGPCASSRNTLPHTENSQGMQCARLIKC